ncbi:helix-turn-helix domain-containing protein [Butyrivibrio sp. M55]|uniref:helix-turn-helix domain-containing protein n=1 Tax=Butyrivibrio sp. M55 TaxID=1855323 RepID=UPI0008F1C592|nr:helix-turn-helix transcriptional regulator [Butyrivibrio sp. M55]SFU54357.1 Cro/C1-type HTH DNA-binding domain-containing protein [Butyrivibrio sp. M55]
MRIKELLEEKNKSIYRLSKETGIPYSTLNDICNNKTQIIKCSVEIVFKISKSLDVTMEDLVEDEMEPRPSFENFKSNTCHRVKELGAIDFILEILEHDRISYYYKKEWYPECFYLLAMTDYLCKQNDIPLCDIYDEIRKKKLKEIVYPKGILALYSVSKDESILENAKKNSIKEFLKYNIVESEIGNVF